MLLLSCGHFLYIAAIMPLFFADQLQTVAASRSPPSRGVYESQTARKDLKDSAKKTGAAPSAHHTPLLNASGIIKRFGDFTANDEVNFSIYEGEIHALLGENGAGKSTFVKMVYGLMQPDAGVFEWRGEACHDHWPTTRA